MAPGAGFWKRPVSRTYAYNLDLGEHYYHPMTSYLTYDRGTRGETPGAMTYSERLARRWLAGRHYGAYDAADRYCRASSVGLSSSYLAHRDNVNASRARSEMREYVSRERTPPFDAARDPFNVSAFSRYGQSLLDSSHALRQDSLNRQQAMAARRSADVQSDSVTQRASALRTSQMARHQIQSQQQMEQQQQQQQAMQQQQQQQKSVRIVETRRRIDDDILKRISDVHISPYSVGQESDEAASASARAKSRIMELERELDEITKKALTASSHQRRTAAQLAKQAMSEEDAMAQSYKKSRKVMVESSSKMQQA